MIYLMIILLIVSQFIHFIFYQKILFSIKRRYKLLDGQLRNLSQWVTSNDQAISNRLQQIHDLVSSQYTKPRMQDVNEVNAVNTESASLSMHMQVSHKQALEKITTEDIQQYYALLLHELQQLDNSLNKMRQQTESVTQPANPVNISMFKNEMINRLHNMNRLNK